MNSINTKLKSQQNIGVHRRTWSSFTSLNRFSNVTKARTFVANILRLTFCRFYKKFSLIRGVQKDQKSEKCDSVIQYSKVGPITCNGVCQHQPNFRLNSLFNNTCEIQSIFRSVGLPLECMLLKLSHGPFRPFLIVFKQL